VKAVSITGIILIVLGIASLAYQVSPARFMIRAMSVQPKTNALAPMLGGAALVGGGALLFAGRRKD
jgi:LPXTG-motif cell wall-anchored protein